MPAFFIFMVVVARMHPFYCISIVFDHSPTKPSLSSLPSLPMPFSVSIVHISDLSSVRSTTTTTTTTIAVVWNMDESVDHCDGKGGGPILNAVDQEANYGREDQ